MNNLQRKISYLDGIRGVSAFLVFFGHFLQTFYPACYSACYVYNIDPSYLNGIEIEYGKSVFSVLSCGDYFVCVFFVLSGYVLSRQYFRTNNFKLIISGVNRRFLRLYIPVAVTLIISFLIMISGLYYNQTVAKISHSVWLGQMWAFPHPFQRLLADLRSETMFRGDNSFDTVLWTISAEFTGSLFVFAFLALTHKAKHKFVYLFLVLFYCKFTENYIITAFALGISLNYAENFPTAMNRYFINLIAVFIFAIALIMGSYPLRPEATVTLVGTAFEHMPKIILEYNRWFHPIGAYLFVLSFVFSRTMQRVIANKVFVFLGYISFALYLVHPLIIGSFGCYIFLQLFGRFDYNYSVALLFPITIIVCIALSWLMTKFVDDPSVKFSKYVYERWLKSKEVE